jgi:hypothetical protein
MATPSNLKPGVRLLSTVALTDPDVIARSAGIADALGQYPQLPYLPGAFVPRLPWRPVDREEGAVLLGSIGSERAGCWLQVIESPEAIFESAAPLREAARRAGNERELDHLRATPEFAEALRLAREFAQSLVLPRTTAFGDNIYFNQPGLPTTSNHRDPILLGIHTDTVCNVRIAERRYSPTRLCLNLGDEPRYLLFINLSLDQIEAMLDEARVTYTESPGEPPLSAFRAAFMSTFDDYPVLKLRIDPGQGYLAPTENVIHDGCTEGRATFDIFYMAHGHFRPQSRTAGAINRVESDGARAAVAS